MEIQNDRISIDMIDVIVCINLLFFAIFIFYIHFENDIFLLNLLYISKLLILQAIMIYSRLLKNIVPN